MRSFRFLFVFLFVFAGACASRPPVVIAPQAVGPAPRHWAVSASRDEHMVHFGFGTDTAVRQSGARSAVLWWKGGDPKAQTSFQQAVSPGGHRGRRLRVTAQATVAGIGTAMLWARTDGNFAGRPSPLTYASETIAAREGWQPVTLTIVVPASAQVLRFGASMMGAGTIWLDGVALEWLEKLPGGGKPEAPAGTWSDEAVRRQLERLRREPPLTAPQNLDFER